MEYLKFRFHATIRSRIITAIEGDVLFKSWMKFLGGPFAQRDVPMRMYHRTGKLLVQSFEESTLSLLQQVVLVTTYKRFHPAPEKIGADESFAAAYQELRLWAKSLNFLYSKEEVKQDMARLIRSGERYDIGYTQMVVDMIFRLHKLTGQLDENEFIRYLGKLIQLEEFGEDELARIRDRFGDIRFKRLLRAGAQQAYQTGNTRLGDQLSERCDELVAA